MALSLQETFGSLKDPRVERNKKHQLLDIIVLTLCAVISGAEGWESIEQFGEDKLDWLRKWIPLENGIPSHDCIARVISRLLPPQMTECFIAWTQSVAQITEGEVVAIDGKTVRRSYDRQGSLGAIHMVSAWASKAGMSLGQVKTEAKSNEITAIPVLLQMLEIKGCIITIDAMGCQTEIAAEIIEKKADYVLAVKDNQKLLHEAVVDYFAEAIAADNPKLCRLQQHGETDAGHGRVETRRFYLSACLDTLPDAGRWKGLKSIGMVECERTVRGETSIERRHYLALWLTSSRLPMRCVRIGGLKTPCIGCRMSPSGKMTRASALGMRLKTLILSVNFPLTCSKGSRPNSALSGNVSGLH